MREKRRGIEREEGRCRGYRKGKEKKEEIESRREQN
jgi:hypothetical protein